MVAKHQCCTHEDVKLEDIFWSWKDNLDGKKICILDVLRFLTAYCRISLSLGLDCMASFSLMIGSTRRRLCEELAK
jgi:hypothetical protein